MKTTNSFIKIQSIGTKSPLLADRFAQIGKLTIGALTAFAILLLIHLSNH